MTHERKNYLAKWQTDAILRKRRWITSRRSRESANKESQEVTDGMETDQREIDVCKILYINSEVKPHRCLSTNKRKYRRGKGGIHGEVTVNHKWHTKK